MDYARRRSEIFKSGKQSNRINWERDKAIKNNLIQTKRNKMRR